MQPSQPAPSRRSAKRALLAALAAFLLSCLTAPAAFAVDLDFTVDPPSPVAGQEVTFTPSNVPQDATVTWHYTSNFDPDGTVVFATGPSGPVTYTFIAAGLYSVTMKVGGRQHTEPVLVRPVAAFHRDPDGSVILETGQPATFTSDSTPGSTLNWEIDGAAFGGAHSVTRSFAEPGIHVVSLAVVQNGVGGEVPAISSFRVNAPPVPGFVWTPGSPVAGAQVQLYSTSLDAEGALADQNQAWELNGDGDFDDAFGPSVARTFTAGTHDISLRVTDRDGVSRTVTRRITVAASSLTSASPLTSTSPPLMKPFPTVRIVGVVLPRGARITLLEVRGSAHGARVTVRCTGGGCPFRSRRRIAETGRVRISAFKRVLVAGARIQVLVRAPGVIGKYTGFRIRAGKRPLRSDRCLMPGATTPTRCT